jgi:glutaredoxin
VKTINNISFHLQSAEEALIIKKITTKPCVVFSKSYCPYCRRAKGILQQEGAKCEVIEMDQREDGQALQARLGALTGKRPPKGVHLRLFPYDDGWISGKTARRCRPGSAHSPVRDHQKGYITL